MDNDLLPVRITMIISTAVLLLALTVAGCVNFQVRTNNRLIRDCIEASNHSPDAIWQCKAGGKWSDRPPIIDDQRHRDE